MTVLEVLQRSTEFLKKKGVDSPRLCSELLLAHVLKTQRLKLYLDFNRVLETSEADQMRALVTRRANREPLQHLLGSACFCGLEIKVTPAVLIPRPETESLAQEAATYLKQLSPPKTFLDFGTGSGCIAITILQECPDATGIAVDKSADALEVARANVEHHQMTNRLQLLLGDAFGALPSGVSFSLIVSNPPYIPTGEIPTLQPEVKDYDPRVALEGGADGLDFYRLLAAEGPPFLAGDGRLMAEFGDGQAEPISRIFRDHNWIVEKVLPDYSGRSRILIAHKEP